MSRDEIYGLDAALAASADISSAAAVMRAC